MFGYIKPRKTELTVGEHEVYKSVYCGLCRALDTNVCGLSTLVLSYDVVFLALFRVAAAREKLTLKKKRCIAHMLNPRVVAFSGETLGFCARVSTVLSYFKLKDDLKDERGFERFKKLPALPFLSGFRRKAKVDPALEEDVVRYLEELDGLENSENYTPDACAEVFGRLLGRISSFGFEGSVGLIANEFGVAVGRWIYLIDALDDLKEDAEKNEFNPFSGCEDLSTEEIAGALDFELTRAVNAFDLLDCRDRTVSGIIYNILKLGMPDTAREILKGVKN